ncbi:hypothetical protein MKW92_047328 [Papaver armeniacum]|nr:hypothetical protein MKW92_047328 [Papaver armeniacum]
MIQISGSSSSSGTLVEIGSTHIVSGYGCVRKEMVSSIALGKKRAGYCFENTRQQVEKCSRREFTETSLKKDVLTSDMARDVLWVGSYCGQTISSSNQQQQQHHHPLQQHHQHSRQSQQHHRYPLQSQQHHQYPQEEQQQQHHQHPKKPLQHHHRHTHHQYQLAGVHRENTSILGAGTAIGRPIHLRINMKNARANCYVPHVH